MDATNSTGAATAAASGTATAQQKSAKERAAAHKVARDFEALMIGMMLKSMRATVSEDKLTGGGHGEEMYRSLLDQEYANAAAARGGLGLAQAIERQLVGPEPRKPQAGSGNNGGAAQPAMNGEKP